MLETCSSDSDSFAGKTLHPRPPQPSWGWAGGTEMSLSKKIKKNSHKHTNEDQNEQERLITQNKTKSPLKNHGVGFVLAKNIKLSG